jgi:hypothetical protein
MGSRSLARVEWKIGDSHFWSCIMKVKLDFLRFDLSPQRWISSKVQERKLAGWGPAKRSISLYVQYCKTQINDYSRSYELLPS